MKKKQLFYFSIQNNTGTNVPVSILNGDNPDSIVNALTRYRWDITAASFADPSFTILARTISQSSYTTYSGTASSATALIAALNALHIGTFWLVTDSGNTYVETYNDGMVYGELTLGAPVTTSQWITTGGLQVNNIAVTSSASISVENLTTGFTMATSSGIPLPPSFIPYVWNLSKPLVQLNNGNTLQCNIDASPVGAYNISLIILENGIQIVNTNTVGASLSANFTYLQDATYDFTAVIN